MPKENKEEINQQGDQKISMERLLVIVGKKEVMLSVAQEQIAFLTQKLNEADARIKELEGKKKKIKE